MDADFAGAQIARFGGAPDDLFDGQKVAFFREMAAAEGAKAALLDADVGEVDVAIDDVADDIADGLGAQLIGGGEHRQQIGAFGLEERGRLVDAQILPRKRAVENRPGRRDTVVSSRLRDDSRCGKLISGATLRAFHLAKLNDEKFAIELECNPPVRAPVG